MDEPQTPQPARAKTPLRRFLAAALSGGLGIFGLAVDSTAAANAQTATTPPAKVASADPPGD